MKLTQLFLTLAVGLGLWICPPPEGITLQAWHLFSIFVATIFGMIAKPLPMGAVAFTGLCAVVLTDTLSFSRAFQGFSEPAVWLIVFAFFIARGIIKTGLGSRLSYFFMMLLGKKTLGLGYGIVATDLLLAPAIPSSTARTGGVLLPILEALANSYHSYPNDPSARKIGSYLIKVAAQSSTVTSAMFLTAMAANPLVADIAEKSFGFEITWGEWAIAALVPGLVSLLLIPLVMFKLYPPEIKESPDATALAKSELNAMGKIKRPEWIMIATFILLVILWILAKPIGIKPVVTAMFGLVILLVTNVLTWEDVRSESGAWETLIWFAVLITLATELGNLGFTSYVNDVLVRNVQGLDWHIGLVVLSVGYLYSHYFFASNLAHVGAMYATFLGVAIALGAPVGLAALVLGFFSSLFGALTQYACGPSALLFGLGYVRISTWWQAGFIISVMNVLIWLTIGSVWWKILGLW